MEIRPCSPVKLCFFGNFQKHLSTKFFLRKLWTLGVWALLSGTYPCVWVSTYHQDSCLWRCDLNESQQVNGITADNYLNNFPDAPTSRSNLLVPQMSCFDCLVSFIIPWHFSLKTSDCNLIASLSCSTSTAAIWNGRWRWFGEAEGSRAGGLDPTQVVMAGSQPAQPSSSLPVKDNTAHDTPVWISSLLW